MSCIEAEKKEYSVTEKEIESESRDELNEGANSQNSADKANKILTKSATGSTEIVANEKVTTKQEATISSELKKETKVDKLTKEFEKLTTIDKQGNVTKKKQHKHAKQLEKNEPISENVEGKELEKTRKVYRKKKYYRRQRKPSQQKKEGGVSEKVNEESKAQNAPRKKENSRGLSEPRNMERKHKYKHHYGRRKCSGGAYGPAPARYDHWHSSNTPFIRPDRKNATRLGSAGDVNVSHQSSTREIVKSVELSSDKNRRGFGQNPFSRPRRNENRNRRSTRKYTWEKKRYEQQNENNSEKVEGVAELEEEDKENMPMAA